MYCTMHARPWWSYAWWRKYVDRLASYGTGNSTAHVYCTQTGERWRFFFMILIAKPPHLLVWSLYALAISVLQWPRIALSYTVAWFSYQILKENFAQIIYTNQLHQNGIFIEPCSFFSKYIKITNDPDNLHYRISRPCWLKFCALSSIIVINLKISNYVYFILSKHSLSKSWRLFFVNISKFHDIEIGCVVLVKEVGCWSTGVEHMGHIACDRATPA